MYKKAHAAIRKDPVAKPIKKPVPATRKRFNRKPLTKSQRDNRVLQKQRAYLKAKAAGGAQETAAAEADE